MPQESASFLMIQATASDAGKSLLVAGLARAATNRGFTVKPFKPQNMSNNAAVVDEGLGEIGRAQQLQARACRTPSCVHMNPVLLKPQGNHQSQLIVHGRYQRLIGARDFLLFKQELLNATLVSFRKLQQEADFVIIEGAGSASEINLRKGDIANMGFACAVAAPVILLGDIHRGGVIASLCGTHLLLSDLEKKLVKGYVINKFKGDITLFDNALKHISHLTSWPALGVVPWFEEAATLPQEDSLALEQFAQKSSTSQKLHIAVPHCPHISNFDDLDPLRLEQNVTLSMVEPYQPIPSNADVIILPGSKNTIGDLNFMRQQGWDTDILAHARQNKWIVGLCGGFQMLGENIFDPDAHESSKLNAKGLGLLTCSTTLTGKKHLTHKQGWCHLTNTFIKGYEMHLGRTSYPRQHNPFANFEQEQHEGIVHKNIIGTYLHGLFANDEFRQKIQTIWGKPNPCKSLRYDSNIENTIDQLAEHLEKHLDINAVLRIAKTSTQAATHP